MTRDSKIMVGFATLLVLFGVVGLASYVSTQALIDSNSWVVNTQAVMQGLEQVVSALQGAETEQRGFLLTGQDSYLEPYNRAAGVIQNQLANLTELTKDNPTQQADIGRLRELTDSKLAVLRQTIDLRRQSGLDAAVAVVRTDRGTRIMDDIRALIGQMEEREQRLLLSRQQRFRSDATRATVVIVGGIPVSLLMLAVAAVILIRSKRANELVIQPDAGGVKWSGRELYT